MMAEKTFTYRALSQLIKGEGKAYNRHCSGSNNHSAMLISDNKPITFSPFFSLDQIFNQMSSNNHLVPYPK